jgi:flagellar protein FliS
MPAPVDAYRTQTIETADPATIVTLLYEGALKAVRRAAMHHEAGRAPEAFDSIGKAVLILGELMAALDMNQGVVAERLSSLYGYCMRRLAEANGDEILTASAEVERYLVRVSDAWKRATAQLRVENAVQGSSGAAA